VGEEVERGVVPAGGEGEGAEREGGGEAELRSEGGEAGEDGRGEREVREGE